MQENEYQSEEKVVCRCAGVQGEETAMFCGEMQLGVLSPSSRQTNEE